MYAINVCAHLWVHILKGALFPAHSLTRTHCVVRLVTPAGLPVQYPTFLLHYTAFRMMLLE